MSHRAVSRRVFMNAASAGTLLAGSVARAQSSQKPNFIVICCDDLGYGDLHSYGSQLATPNLDQMAEEGVQFSRCYAANNICSPSRAGLLTGFYPTRVGVPAVLWPTDTTGIAVSAPTIAQVLKPAGYATMCTGKWHVGSQAQFMPMSRGFDHYYGIPYSSDMSPSILIQDGVVIESPVVLNTLTQRYTQQSVNFIASNKSNPFFLYLAYNSPHLPLTPSAAFLGKSPMGLYGDSVQEIDWSVGQILQARKLTESIRTPWSFSPAIMGPGIKAVPGGCEAGSGRLMKARGSQYRALRVSPVKSAGNRSLPERATSENSMGRISNARSYRRADFPHQRLRRWRALRLWTGLGRHRHRAEPYWKSGQHRSRCDPVHFQQLGPG